jgi:hypothetical protein
MLRLAFFGSVLAPGPQRLCENLVKRHLAKNCADDPTVQLFGGRAASFELLSSGRIGRIVTFGDVDAYKHAMHSIAENELWSTASNHFGTKRTRYVFASKAARFLLYVPTPIDRIDESGFIDFESNALDPVETKTFAPEHPIHSDVCARSTSCIDEGKCAIYSSASDTCVAGFNEDCIASTGCAKGDKCSAFGDGVECH